MSINMNDFHYAIHIILRGISVLGKNVKYAKNSGVLKNTKNTQILQLILQGIWRKTSYLNKILGHFLGKENHEKKP